MSRRERAAGARLHQFEAITDAALSGLQLDELLAELLERTRELLSADTAAILLLDESSKQLVATAAVGLEEEVRQGVRIPFGEGFAGRVAATGQPVTLDRVDHTTTVNQIVIDKQLASLVGVPIFADHRVTGVLHVGSLKQRRFTDDDVDLLRLVADRASLAVQARSSQLDRAAALALQRSLLPALPPMVAGLDVAARYIPGTEVGVGGDWYDLLPLPSGHVGVAIGDVAGNGLRAAVVMGRIRGALRAYAIETDDPTDVLTRLDREIQLFEPDVMATAIYAVINPAHTMATMSVAGHLPPVLVDHAGKAELLAAPTDLPLGAHRTATRRSTATELPPGSTLLLYTDGLIERRYRPLSQGIRALLDSVAAGSAEALCSRLTMNLLRDQAPTDDVAILAVHRTSNAQAQ